MVQMTMFHKMEYTTQSGFGAIKNAMLSEASPWPQPHTVRFHSYPPPLSPLLRSLCCLLFKSPLPPSPSEPSVSSVDKFPTPDPHSPRSTPLLPPHPVTRRRRPRCRAPPLPDCLQQALRLPPTAPGEPCEHNGLPTSGVGAHPVVETSWSVAVARVLPVQCVLAHKLVEPKRTVRPFRPKALTQVFAPQGPAGGVMHQRVGEQFHGAIAAQRHVGMIDVLDAIDPANRCIIPRVVEQIWGRPTRAVFGKEMLEVAQFELATNIVIEKDEVIVVAAFAGLPVEFVAPLCPCAARQMNTVRMRLEPRLPLQQQIIRPMRNVVRHASLIGLDQTDVLHVLWRHVGVS